MALIFQRLARNFAKNGYFPTDSESLGRILAQLQPSQRGVMRILDPCCGEGIALAECKHHLHHEALHPVEAYGVEFDPERAAHAKQLLDRCIQGDFQDTVLSLRNWGLLFLNPPYGDLVTDTGHTGDRAGKGRKRLEKIFFQQTVKTLHYGGILVLIVPHTSLDMEFRRWIAAGFERVSVYLAPKQQFKQAVVIGIRRRTSTNDDVYSKTLEQLNRFCEQEVKPVLPERPEGALYHVPSAAQNGDVKFQATRIDPGQLQEEIQRYSGLWPQFKTQLNPTQAQTVRLPLMPLTEWHLALALAAGQISGIVRSEDGKKTYVVKGDTFKDKKQVRSVEIDSRGHRSEVRTATDVFVPKIRAIDFTEGSPNYGRLLTIK